MTKISTLFKSNTRANLALFISILMFIGYKTWKWYLRNEGINPNDDYIKYEALSTLFRLFGGIVCIASAFILYSDRASLYKSKNRSLFFLQFFFVLGFYILKIFTVDATISSFRFQLELPINLTVGFFEEGLFRALLLAGLARYMKINTAVVLSAVIFSLFHFDVIDGYNDYFRIFISGINFALLYILGASILELSLLHFAWDQIVYSITGNGNNDFIAVTTYEILFLGILIFFYNKINKEHYEEV